jgi:hypothetical protein
MFFRFTRLRVLRPLELHPVALAQVQAIIGPVVKRVPEVQDLMQAVAFRLVTL